MSRALRPVIAACLCLVGTGILGPMASAGATTCAAPPRADARLGAIDGRERLLWIDRQLGQEASRARLWGYGWPIGIGAAGVASLAVVPFVARGDRVDWYTSAVSAAVGVLPFVVAPLELIGDAPRVHDALTGTPLDDARVCAVLADAERRLVASASDERLQIGWWTHAGNVAFNAGVLFFLGFGYHHWTSGLINGLSGLAVGEALILTQPTGLIGVADAYARGDLSGEAARADAGRSVALSYGGRF